MATEDTTTACVVARPTPCVPPRTVKPWKQPTLARMKPKKRGLAKPLFFGFILASVGCFQGLTVRGGTQGVGRATTQAVVVSSVAILICNFFLTKVALFLAGHFF